MASRRAFSSCKHDNSDIHQQLQRIEEKQTGLLIIQIGIYIVSLSSIIAGLNKK
jgi:hypothetical protein